MAIDLNALRVEAQRLSQPGGNQNYLENFVPLPEGNGSVVLRLLPTPGATYGFYASTRTHKINGKNVHCPMTEDPKTGRWVGNCPICNWYKELYKKFDVADSPAEAEALQAQARSIKPNPRFYYNCIVRQLTEKDGTVKKNVGPKIFSAGIKLHSKILRAICGDPSKFEEPLGDVTDCNTGRDLAAIKTVEKSGSQSFPNWESSKFLAESVAGTQADWDQWMQNLHDLQSLRRVPTQEDLAREVRVFRGLEQDPDTSFGGDAGVGAADPDDVPLPTARVQIKPTPPAAPKPAAPVQAKTKPVAPPADEADEAMADDDFLAKLRNM